MKMLIDALGASAGGGLTYLWNVLPHFAEHPQVEVFVLADRSATLSNSGNVTILEAPGDKGALRRFAWEQAEVSKYTRKFACNVLLCTGNFAIWNSPVPQILLSRNSLYTSLDFSRDLRERREYRMLLETRLKASLARHSIKEADLTIAPSESFARELETWTQHEIVALHHGFDRERFFADTDELPPEVKQKLHATEGTVRLLFVSHYNYYRNFETLLKAVAVLKQRLPSRELRLVLTCELSDTANPGNYRTGRARQLIRELDIENQIVQLGAIAYSQLHNVYRACDLYVTPAYTETFAHPLVEAMASGLPVVASDLPVHREITDGAGLFFEKFSPAGLADRVAELLNSPSLGTELRQKGLSRSATFSWKKHTDRLVEAAASLVRNGKAKTGNSSSAGG
jgi:glycosyltransferase involved in cell wall biosynthesis